MMQNQQQKLRDLSDLSTEESARLEMISMPATAEGRSALRKRLINEVAAATEEKNVLSQLGEDHDPQSIPSHVGNVTKAVVARTRAMNPIRDFDRVGTKLFGYDNWETIGSSAPDALLGLITGAIGGVVTATVSGNVAAGVGAGIFCAAPVFLTTWTGRTLFNLAAGIGTYLAAPFIYFNAWSRDTDTSKGRGLRNAKTFLEDLENSLIAEEEHQKEIQAHIEQLNLNVQSREALLLEIEKQEGPPDRVECADAKRFHERYTKPDLVQTNKNVLPD